MFYEKLQWADTYDYQRAAAGYFRFSEVQDLTFRFDHKFLAEFKQIKNFTLNRGFFSFTKKFGFHLYIIRFQTRLLNYSAVLSG